MCRVTGIQVCPGHNVCYLAYHSYDNLNIFHQLVAVIYRKNQIQFSAIIKLLLEQL